MCDLKSADTNSDHDYSFKGGVGGAADTLLSVLECKQHSSHQQCFVVLFFLLIHDLGGKTESQSCFSQSARMCRRTFIGKMSLKEVI